MEDPKFQIITLDDIREEVPIMIPTDGTEGVMMTLFGIVMDVIHEFESNTVYFNLQVMSLKENIFCVYHYQNYYPILNGDSAQVIGSYEEIIFMAQRQRGFMVSSMTARYEFDLTNLLSNTFPELETSENLQRIAANMQQYASNYYEPGPEGLRACFDSLCSNLSKNNQEIVNFTHDVYGSTDPDKIAKIKKFLHRYLNDALKRPLQLMGLSDDEIDEIHISLASAYRIVQENPFRLPEIKKEKAESICRRHLRIMEIPEEWIVCGNMNRYIYLNLTRKGWTSTPVVKMKASFPSSYEPHRDLLKREYFCVEDLDHVYYAPIKKKEEMVAEYLSRLVKAPDNHESPVLYLGVQPSDEQDQAVKGALFKRISIITGGAGTGKTKILGHVAHNLVRGGATPLFISFTGVATVRIKASLIEAEVLDKCKVMTIHMAISLFHSMTDLNISHVVFDEFSMVNLMLFYQFINTFSVMKLSYVFVGDINQLEPIGFGTVMEQLMKTPISVFRLTQNFRSQTGIVSLLNDIVNPERMKKQEPINWYRDCPDYQFYKGDIGMLEQFIKFQHDSFPGGTLEQFIAYRDLLTIVTPYRKFVGEINNIFQRIFMTQFPFQEIDGQRYHIHDRVMKLINNHSIEVMNGEVGKIIEINPEYVVVKFRDYEGGIVCPFFSKSQMKKVKTLIKSIKYSPYDTKMGVKTPKDMEVITRELEEMKNKTRGFVAKGLNEEDIANFFDVSIKYPFAIFGMGGDSEFLSLKHLNLSYAVTTHKSQGDQYPVALFFMSGKATSFVSIKNVYTGLSRAKERLIVMADNQELMNSCILTYGKFTYENLAPRINKKLPEELTSQIDTSGDPEPILEGEDFGFDAFDDDDFIDDLF